MRCGLKFSQNHNHTVPHLIFAITYAVRCIRCGLNDLKLVYFTNFGLFLPSLKLIFPFLLGQVLNYWASFSLFWVGFPSQHLLGLSNYIYIYIYLKTRVIKPLIIYLILKINILIYREGAVWCSFLIIKPQIALHHELWCTITCDAVLLCYFAGGFGAICVVWWTPLITVIM